MDELDKPAFLADDFAAKMNRMTTRCFEVGKDEGMTGMMIIAIAENPDAVHEKDRYVAWVNSNYLFGPQVFALIRSHLITKHGIPPEAIMVKEMYKYCPHCGKELT